MAKHYRLENGRLQPAWREVVEEFALRLRVNGRELTTLVCSPHQLNFMVAGFFRLQGFADSLDEILSMAVCSDFGLADVRLKKELPEKLQPTLTSGCGTGIAYNLPRQLLADSCSSRGRRSYSTDSLFRLMRQLGRQAEQYRSHGGIHSAAVGDEDGLLLYSEDIGRHNTLDRLAGEAWFRQVELRDRMLVTSGRVSTEMVAKAARLGIGLIASRTSPTDKAIDLCEQAGITLIGYLRGESLELYTCPDQLRISRPEDRIPVITTLKPSDGKSLRTGRPAAVLPIHFAHSSLGENLS